MEILWRYCGDTVEILWRFVEIQGDSMEIHKNAVEIK